MATIKKFFLLGLILGLVICAASLPAAENIMIQVHLFKGAWAEDHPGLKEVTVMTAASLPAIAALRAKLDAPQSELTIATIDALMEVQELKTVDDYFAYSAKWDGRVGTFNREIEHQMFRFKFVFVPRWISPQRLELKVALYQSGKALFQTGKSPQEKMTQRPTREKTSARMDKLLDTRLLLDLDAPVIVGMPSGREAFFMLICARKAGETSGREADAGVAKSPTKQTAPIKAPRAVQTLMPAYPEELRQQGVQGQVTLQAVIDESGTVVEVKVAKSLHPYLDFAAVQAVRQWKYLPAVQDGNPIAVRHDVTIFFDPETYRKFEEKANAEAIAERGEKPAAGHELERILGGAADYCRKLAGASLDFISEEKIGEVHYNFATDPKWFVLTVGSRETGQITKQTWIPAWDPERTERNNYVCDYLLVRKGERIEERRIILKENGRKMPDCGRLLEEKRFTALNPVLAAIKILDAGRQPMSNFRLIGTDNVLGRKARVIEAIPKSGNTWGVEYAKIWVDQASFQVLRSEIQGIPLEGYDDVLRDAVQFRVRPYLLTTHAYGLEKNGVMFPTRSTIRVEYPMAGVFYGQRTLKLKIDMEYDKYKFFTVETESGIKK
jgi:protein TonB